MIRAVLSTVFVLLILGLLAYWLITGGAQRAWQAGKNFMNPVATVFNKDAAAGTGITLPWQPEMTRGPDISEYVSIADKQQQTAGTQQAQGAADLTRNTQYGSPSPYAGKVVFASNNAADTDPAAEYVEIQASSDTDAAVPISGWVLQSAVSGAYAVVPQAADVLMAGAVNSIGSVLLPPGGSAIVSTGASPVGVSFRENICSGYLSELQRFSPGLNEGCPSPADIMPQTADNLRTFGASCFDYLSNLPSCHFAGAELPANLTPACRSFITGNLSYNGCVAMFRTRTHFTLPSWRLYLATNYALWDSAHDVIRLLDEHGRVVDVLSY